MFRTASKLSGSINNSECCQTLKDLGLTPLQAKTYLALAKIGTANVASISKTSNTVREEIYRVMPKLAKMGLVEKIIGRPILYEALPLKAGLCLLIQRRTQETAELHTKTLDLIQNLHENNTSDSFMQEKIKFIITSELKLFRKRLEASIKKTQSTISVIAPPKAFEGMVFNHFTSLKKALRRNVRIRVITEKTKEKTMSKKIQMIKKNRFLKLKYWFTNVPVTMGIFDGKETNLRLTKGLVPSLWSNNPVFVKLTSNYFNDLWNQAKLR
jgi:sugar-specific transcriptional regulator TrmB